MFLPNATYLPENHRVHGANKLPSPRENSLPDSTHVEHMVTSTCVRRAGNEQFNNMLEDWRGAKGSSAQRNGIPSLDAQGADFALTSIFGS